MLYCHSFLRSPRSQKGLPCTEPGYWLFVSVIILEVALNVEIHSVISQWGDGRNVMFLNGKKMPKNGKAQTCKKMQNAKKNTKKCKMLKSKKNAKRCKKEKKMQTCKKDAKIQKDAKVTEKKNMAKLIGKDQHQN